MFHPGPCLFGSRDERTESVDATKTNRVRSYPSGESHEILAWKAWKKIPLSERNSFRLVNKGQWQTTDTMHVPVKREKPERKRERERVVLFSFLLSRGQQPGSGTFSDPRERREGHDVNHQGVARFIWTTILSREGELGVFSLNKKREPPTRDPRRTTRPTANDALRLQVSFLRESLPFSTIFH